MLGSYPSTFTTEGNPQVINLKGRMVPTTPWEGLWHAIGAHVGVDAATLTSTILPNANNFASGSTLITREQLFE